MPSSARRQAPVLLLESRSYGRDETIWLRYCIERRREEEAAVRTLSEVPADELRRRHGHLQKLGVDLVALGSRVQEMEEKLDERRDAMVEARREVKTLEVLFKKEHAREKRAEGRRQQRILDDLAARKHRGRLQ
ncbi:MAG: hypothetical protein E2P02_07625 [Acidobacteria bacterium]|nr:MAG: hypothetical protein E2P02_07625 [Acidobacteriota bacterium]